MLFRSPDLLDPWRAVAGRSNFSGRLPLSGLSRLREMLRDDSGEVAYRLAFWRDEGQRAVVTGEVRASLTVQCQRCLGSFGYEVNAKVALALVHGMDEARQLPEQYDPLMVTESLIRPGDLIEEELLLSLPQIPMHDAEYCTAAVEAAIAETDPDVAEAHPFAVLSSLKREH